MDGSCSAAPVEWERQIQIGASLLVIGLRSAAGPDLQGHRPTSSGRFALLTTAVSFHSWKMIRSQ
jgi:hypothetical protein